MNLEQRLRKSLVAPDPGAVFTARVMALVPRDRARSGRRFFVIGTVLVAGVAAAMLVWQMSDVQPASTDVAAIPAIRATADPAPVADESVTQVAPIAEQTLTTPLPALPLPAVPHFSVLVMPLRLDAQDASGRVQVEAFHSALVEELRKVPNIFLQGPGGSADHVLTITTVPSRDTGRMRTIEGRPVLDLNTRLSGVSVDMDIVIDPLTGNKKYGEISSVEAGGLVVPGSVWIELRADSRGAATARNTFPMGPEGSAGESRCAAPDASLKTDCMTPEMLAARQVEKLRMQVFPPDAALQQQIVARLGNASLTQAEQMQILQDLLLLQGQPEGSIQGHGSRLDGATLRALTRYAADLPAFVRGQLWVMLRRMPQPELIAPLVESLRRDPDKQVRLEALATLRANFATDPAFKAALESVAQKDPDQLVRMAARRELYGTAQWRSDVLAIVDNSSLTYESRLAPLRERTDAFSNQLHELMQDQQVLRRVVELVREHLGESDHVQPTFEMLVLLSNVKDPLVSDLFAEARRRGIITPQAVSGPGTVTLIDGRISVSGSGQKGDDPFVPSNLLERMEEVTRGGKPAGQ